MSKAARNLKTNIATAVINAVSDPKVLADVSAAPAIVEAVTKQIAPEIINATNNEPWFRSRVTWGAIASIVLAISVRSIIEGLSVPDFKGVIETAERLHRAMPYIDYVGWDFAVTDDGICVIEANNTTDVDLIQVHGPLLADDRVVRFYQANHVL